MSNILFDARSAGTTRLTGWERYTRGVVSIVSTMKGVSIRAAQPRSLPGRILEDVVGIRMGARGYDFAHFPSYPPGPGFHLDKSIYTLHDLTWWLYPETASVMGRLYYKRLATRAIQSRVVVTVSQAVKLEIESRWPGAEVRVVSPFVTLDPDSVPADHSRDRPYFLAVGSIEPRKNLARLARAFEASGLSNDFDLVLVGRAAWGALPAGVEHLGAVSDGQLSSLIRSAQAVFVPSLYEGFGLPVAEALALGTRVACSDISVFREVGGDNVAYFDPLDVDGIAAVLLAEASAPAGRDCLNMHTRDVTQAQLTSLYAELGIEF